MKRHAIVLECKKKAEEAILYAIDSNEEYARATVAVPSGVIEIYADELGAVATVTHHVGNSEAPCLELEIEKSIDWERVFGDWVKCNDYHPEHRLWDEF